MFILNDETVIYELCDKRTHTANSRITFSKRIITHISKVIRNTICVAAWYQFSVGGKSVNHDFLEEHRIYTDG